MDKFTAKQRVTQLIAHNFIHVESTDDYVHTFNTLKNTVDNVEELLLDLIDKIYNETDSVVFDKETEQWVTADEGHPI